MAPFGWDHYNAGSGEDGEEVGLTLAVNFRYELRVKVISANGLPSGNDPYAVVKLDYMTRKTRFIPNTTTPNWGEEVTEGEGGSAENGFAGCRRKPDLSHEVASSLKDEGQEFPKVIVNIEDMMVNVVRSHFA